MHEDRIIESICDAIQKALANQNESRAFEFQTRLTGGVIYPNSGGKGERAALLPKKRLAPDHDEDGDVFMVESAPDATTGKLVPQVPNPLF